jgi:hypothetical protein
MAGRVDEPGPPVPSGDGACGGRKADGRGVLFLNEPMGGLMRGAGGKALPWVG